MPTLIGLDLGTQRVKAGVVKGRPGRLRVISYHERALPVTETREEWHTALLPALEGLHREMHPGSTPVIVSLPGQLAILRTVTVPFTRVNEIQAVLPGQVEAQLPVPIEDVVTDYEIVRQDGRQSELFVAAVLRSDLQSLVLLLEKAGFEPASVTLDLFALSNAAAGSDTRVLMENALILDLGAGATKAVFLREGRLVNARAFRLGGNSLTGALQSAMGVGVDAAETMKVETEDLSAVSSEKFRETVGETYGRIGREARMFLASLGQAGSIDALLLTGGGSTMAGAESALEVGQNAEVRRLSIPPDAELPSRFPDRPDRAGAWLSVILGSCLPGLGADLKAHNLLRGEVSVRQEKSVRGALAVCLALLAILFGLVCSRLYREVGQVRGNVDRLREAQATVWREAFPDRPALPKARAIQQMDDRLQELEQQVRAVGSAPDRRSALRTLSEVLRRVPEGQDFVLKRMNLSPSVVSLTGETDSLKSAMAIERSIDESPLVSCKLNSADKIRDRPDSKTERVRFQFEIRTEGPSADGVQP